MSDRPSVGGRLLAFAATVLLAALCLWWAVHLLAQIWGWLLGAVIIGVTLGAGAWGLRRGGERW